MTCHQVSRMLAIAQTLLVLQVGSYYPAADAFQPTVIQTPSPTIRSSASSQLLLAATSDDDSKEEMQSSNDLFSSDAWQAIKKDLDQVPIFTPATAEGHPLAYKIKNAKGTFEVPTFYCDLDAATKELADVRGGMESGADSIDLIPFPLGQAFQLWSKSEAMIIPSKDAVLQAGAPPGTNPIGQNVPLFGCMEIMEEREDGKGVLPMFLSLDDANAAVKLAVEADGGSVDDFEVVALSLNRAVELLASSEESPAFHFIPPSASMKYIQEYLS
jgi:hypothetical protein